MSRLIATIIITVMMIFFAHIPSQAFVCSITPPHRILFDKFNKPKLENMTDKEVTDAAIMFCNPWIQVIGKSLICAEFVCEMKKRNINYKDYLQY